eukprot:scaffold24746_cov75-Phaeocystis_antarctica.AAC.2
MRSACGARCEVACERGPWGARVGTGKRKSTSHNHGGCLSAENGAPKTKDYSHVRSAGRPSPSCNDASAVVPARRGAGEMWREVTFGAVGCGAVGAAISSPNSSRILAWVRVRVRVRVGVRARVRVG